jgi:hypothetical protein
VQDFLKISESSLYKNIYSSQQALFSFTKGGKFTEQETVEPTGQDNMILKWVCGCVVWYEYKWMIESIFFEDIIPNGMSGSHAAQFLLSD